jgi:hypothetical protein
MPAPALGVMNNAVLRHNLIGCARLVESIGLIRPKIAHD